MSKQLIILILVLFAHDAGASLPVDTALNNLQVKLRITKADTNRVKLLQRIGEFYLFKPGEEKADLDSAFHYLNQALNLTMALHQPKFTYDILKYIGNTYVEAGELKKGTDYFMQSIQYYHYNSLFALEADSWGWLGDMYYNNGKNDHISERLIFYARAKNIYLQLHDRKNATLVILQMASTLMSRGDVNGGIKTLTDLTTQYHNEKDTLSEADTWFYLARALIPYDLQYLSLRGQAYVNAYNLYMALYKYVDAANMLNAAARIHVTKGLYKQAEYEFLTAIKLYKHYDTEYLPEAYFWLADLYSVTSDLDKEIASRLKGIESIRGAAKENLLYYSNLAIDYHAAGIKIKSKQYLQKAMSIAMAKGDTTGYVFFLHMFIDDMVDDGNAKQALALLNHKLADLKYLKGPEKVDIADAVGNCYVALKQYEKARPYIETLKGVVKNSSTVKAYAEMANWDYCYFKIINYYILSADFKTAKYYLSNAEKLPQSVISVYTKSKFLQFHYKIDSAGKNYFQALNYFQQYKTLNDSLNSVEKIKRINELEIKYQAAQKNKTIDLLKNQGNTRLAQVQKTTLQRNITISGLAMFLIISGLAYNGYRNKRKSNQVLEAKQIEINSQNSSLQSLLIEKDWLLKEVHHRVKNNLQIIMSLLSSQSAYLENTAAIEAIRESQNRVQAISLIHQKLYTSSNVASINMRAYVADLISYLADCFNARGRGINFEQVVEPFNLDLAQAVPLGLILNESVTNAIKYAFGSDGGQIIVALQLIKKEQLLLTIADNGKGLPINFDFENTRTLGIEMMKALSKQLGGEFKIESKFGVTISIEFQIESILKHSSVA